jgi:hypothetical protein
MATWSEIAGMMQNLQQANSGVSDMYESQTDRDYGERMLDKEIEAQKDAQKRQFIYDLLGKGSDVAIQGISQGAGIGGGGGS